MNGREFSMMQPGKVIEPVEQDIDKIVNGVAREICHRTQATFDDLAIIEIIVKRALAAEQRRADEIDPSCSHPFPQLGCPECGAWLPTKASGENMASERHNAEEWEKAKQEIQQRREQLAEVVDALEALRKVAEMLGLKEEFDAALAKLKAK
jgi:hypothetical protein